MASLKARLKTFPVVRNLFYKKTNVTFPTGVVWQDRKCRFTNVVVKSNGFAFDLTAKLSQDMKLGRLGKS